MKLLFLLAAGIPLFGQTNPQCTSYGLSASGVLSDATATDTTNQANIPSFTVTTQTGCPFVATTSVTWLHALPPTGGTTFSGTSKVLFTIDQNTTDQLRTGTVLVYPGTQVIPGAQALAFTVVQVAGICNYAISPSSVSLPVTGGSGSFTVTTGCTWNAAASPFITATIPKGNVGTQPVNYSVGANPCVAPRTGAIGLVTNTANPPTFQIAQAGDPGNFTLSTTSVSDPATSLTNQKLTITTGAGCGWGSYTDAPNWLHPTAATTGQGPGTYIYSVDANQGSQRTGHVFFQSGIDSQGFPIVAATLTVVQQAAQAPAPVLTAIVNGASYDRAKAAPAPISPGEIVALGGNNLGPVAGQANSGSYGTNLGGVQVMFGSTPAPLIYVSAAQINAVVPYSVTGSTNVAVTVQYSGLISAPLTVPVQATTPGIFSLDATGTGPGAILNNADYSINASARPAAVGSVVDIYCTGAGVTDPASKDGALAAATPPFPVLVAQDVSVTIGGVQAQVVYAGPAPGLINGLNQIDVIVPAGAKGNQSGIVSVPIVLTIGGVSSQANLSVAVQ